MCSIFIIAHVTTFFCFHALNFIVTNQIIKVIKVAIPVICWLVPVKVSVAITNPTSVHRRLSVSLKAITK